jgi:transposase
MHSKPAGRRRHSSELKRAVLAACSEPGASIAAVAMAHGLNANLVRKWRGGRGLKRDGAAAGIVVEPMSTTSLPPVSSSPPLLSADARFVPIELASPAKSARSEPTAQRDSAAVESIHVELRRGTLHLSVRWPTSAAGDCSAWLRELAAGLSK